MVGFRKIPYCFIKGCHARVQPSFTQNQKQWGQKFYISFSSSHVPTHKHRRWKTKLSLLEGKQYNFTSRSKQTSTPTLPIFSSFFLMLQLSLSTICPFIFHHFWLLSLLNPWDTKKPCLRTVTFISMAMPDA